MKTNNMLPTVIRDISELVEEFDEDAVREQVKTDAEVVSAQHNRGTLTGNDVLRLCPPRKGTKILYKEIFRHWVKDRGDGKGAMITCVARMRNMGRCYFCEAINAALRAVDRDDVKTIREIEGQKARSGAYWNAIDMKAPERGAKVYWFPFTVHKAIKTQTGLAEQDLIETPWSVTSGYPIKITRDAKNDYSVRLMKKNVETLSAECYIGMQDLEAQATPPTPRDLFEMAYATAKNYGALSEVDWDDVPFYSSLKQRATERPDPEDELEVLDNRGKRLLSKPAKPANQKMDAERPRRSGFTAEDFELDDQDDEYRRMFGE